MNVCQCPKCNKQLSSKQALDYHLDHESCKKQHVCPRCDALLSSKRVLENHISKNICGKKDKIPVTLKKNIGDKINELQEEILLLKGENKALKEHPQTVINILVPPAFLSIDNYQNMTVQSPNLLHEALTKHPANFISYLIKRTNCNPNMPLYNSIKITNKKDPYAQVSDGKKYVYVPKKTTITQLIENKREILQRYIDENGDKYGEKILRKYQNYSDFLDGDKEAQRDLETEIICMLLNVSDVIGSEDWSKKLLSDLKIWGNNSAPNKVGEPLN
jgi:hypothetical protein